MNKRLAMLEQLTKTPAADGFAWYALAMEYRNEDRPEEALRTFEILRSSFPDYLAQYLMAGQLLVANQRPKEAIPWFEQGLELAHAQGNGKALGELQAALDEAVDRARSETP